MPTAQRHRRKGGRVAPHEHVQSGKGHGGQGGGHGQMFEPSWDQTTSLQGGAPFVRNSRYHDELAFDTGIVALATGQTNFGPKDFPAIGYYKESFLDVNATGGSGTSTSAVAAADAPFNALATVQHLDLGGQELVDVAGWDLAAINCFGGYWWNPNMGLASTGLTAWPLYSAIATTGNFRFQEYLPAEVLWDGFAALANENASQNYKYRHIIEAQGTIYATVPSPTVPSVQVQGWLNAHTRPEEGTQTPPGLGTTCYWSKQQYTGLATGYNTIRLTRTGNDILTMILVFRNSSGVRVDPSNANASLSDFRLRIDGVDIRGPIPFYKLRTETFRDFGIDMPTGVIVISYRKDVDGHPAKDDTGELWLPTKGSTRLEITGTFPSTLSGGTMTVLCQDLVPEHGIPYSDVSRVA